MKTPKTRREREIWRACDELVAEGVPGNKVTGDAIRERLLALDYSKGSPNEVYKYRKYWREARGIMEEDFNQPSQGQVILNDPITRAVEVVRTEIRSEAAIEIATIKQEVNEQVRVLHETLKTIEQELKQSLEKNQLLANENVELKAVQRQLQVDLSDEKQQRYLLKGKLESTESTLEHVRQGAERTQAELKQSHNDAQETAKKELIDTKQYYHKEIDELKTLFESQRHYWIVELDKIKTANKELDIKLGKTESALMQECQKTKELSFELQILMTKHEDTLKENKHYQEDIKGLERDFIATEGQLKEMKNQFEIIKGQEMELQLSLQTKLHTIGQLEERNHQMMAIINERRQSDEKSNLVATES